MQLLIHGSLKSIFHSRNTSLRGAVYWILTISKIHQRLQSFDRSLMTQRIKPQSKDNVSSTIFHTMQVEIVFHLAQQIGSHRNTADSETNYNFEQTYLHSAFSHTALI